MHWCAMAEPLMASRNISAERVSDKVGRIQLRTFMRRNAVRRFCVPIRSAAAYAGLSGRIAGLTHHDSELDQKKAAQLPPLSQTVIPPDPSDPASSILELDELWSFVAKKTNQTWVWIVLCRCTRKAHRLCDRRPQPTDLSSPVGSHSNSIPSESLQNLLLGSLPSSATRGTAYGGRPRKQAKRPM